MLSDRKCQQAKPGDKLTKLYDSDGLYLYVSPIGPRTPNGSKLWRFRYRAPDGEKTIALGSYPDVSLKAAREAAAQAKADFKNGQNPTELKQQRKLDAEGKTGNTFAEVAADYVGKKSEVWAPGTVESYQRLLDIHLNPELGSIAIGTIEPLAFLAALRKIEDRSTSFRAQECRAFAGQIFRYALANGLCSRDPTPDLRGAIIAPARGHHPALDEERLPKFFQDLEAATMTLSVRLAMDFVALTAVRMSEMLGAEWIEIDWDKREWLIPGNRMKMKRDHIVPLSRQAVEVLRRAQSINVHRRFIFEGRSRRVQDGRVLYTIGQSTLLDVYKRTGYKGEMCTHGFRSVFSTLANRYRARGLHPYDEATIEMQLAHVKEKVKGAYNRDEYIIPRHGLMQWWADFLDDIRGRGIVGDFDGVSATLDCAAE